MLLAGLGTHTLARENFQNKGANTLKIDHLSPSQINTYLKCSLQWFWRYHEGIKIPPKGIMTQSNCIHSSVELNFRQKIDTFLDLPISDVLDNFSTEFNERKHKTAWFKDDKPSAFKDQGINLLGGYQNTIAPTIQPTHVEHEFKIHFDNFDIPLIGRMDLLHSERIADNKCTGKAPSVIAQEAEDSLQLTAYALAYRAEFHRPEKGVSIIALFRPKKVKDQLSHPFVKKPPKEKVPHIETFSATRDMNAINRYLKLMAHVKNAIENDIYFPCDPGNWWCSENFCGFFHRCRKDW